MSVHLMIDLEFLGKVSDSVIVQFGYCVARPGAPEEPNAVWLERPLGLRLNLAEQILAGRVIDESTVRWWNKQKDEVRKMVFYGGRELSVKGLFDHMTEVVQRHKVTDVWSKPAAVDLAMLAHLWGWDRPWSFRSERCLATLVDFHDKDRKLRPKDNHLAHDAAFDAEWQMQYLMNILREAKL
jgi:hypothetical protein